MIEKALSVDNIFVFIVVFSAFAVPAKLLVAIEATDLLFAVDSIHAIFAITSDPFIVYTSNIFAILGLRSLYFALAGAMGKFHYLKVGLSAVLVFVGAKMLLAGVCKIPILASLAVIVATLGASIIASWLRRPSPPPTALPQPREIRTESATEEAPRADVA